MMMSVRIRLAMVLVISVPMGCSSSDSAAPIRPVVATAAVSLPRTTVRIGEILQATAIAMDASGTAVVGRAVTWESTAPAVAEISANGLITSVSAGTTTIKATIEGKVGAASLTVTEFPVASVAVTAPKNTVEVGASVQFSATPKDSLGRTLSRSVSWSSSDEAVALVSSSGLVLARKTGTATVSATADGVSGSQPLTVLAAPVASITVSPDSVNLLAGTMQQLSVTVRDAQGNLVAQPSVGWLYDTGALTISPDLVLSPRISSGRIIVTAFSGTVTTQIVVRIITFNRLRSGGEATCATTAEHLFFCWGRGQGSLQENGSFANALTPHARMVGMVFANFAMSLSNVICGVTPAGGGTCWGPNSFGELGNGTTSDLRSTPTAVAGNQWWLNIDPGGQHTCGIDLGGKAYCWGEYGPALGIGTLSSAPPAVPTPTAVVGGISFAGITAGSNHTCGWTSAGDAYCWGQNGQGQLGNGSTTGSSSVPLKLNGTQKWATLDAGTDYTCGITTTAKAYCWGLGPANSAVSTTVTPFPVLPTADIMAISAGYDHACLVTTTGKAYCFGNNGFGQLGTGTNFDYPLPETVAGNLVFTGVRAGFLHTCGLLAESGAAMCWGDGSSGQRGDGTAIPVQRTPTLVIGN